MSAPLHHLLVGPRQHGVTRYAELLVAAARVPAERVHRWPAGLDPAELDRRARALPEGAPLHLHVTDHLLGGPERCLQAVRALAAGRRLGLTLHDLPQPSDGAPLQRRRTCYAGMVEAAAVVLVSSEHEAALLADLPPPTAPTPVQVVPLAAAPQVAAPGASPGPVAADRTRQVAVLGFVYPGKGHEQVLAAMTGLPADVGLRVLGGPSPGHEDLVQRLHDLGAAARRPVEVDGWVPDELLPGLLRAVAVPVFAPQHVSASASVTAWTAAGRRPVATRNRYSEELEAHRPGTLLLVDDTTEALAAGLAAALADPALTRLPADHRPGPDAAEAARLTFAAVEATGVPA